MVMRIQCGFYGALVEIAVGASNGKNMAPTLVNTSKRQCRLEEDQMARAR